ncbi:transaldolase family protein [Chloroflexota bacterium]
MEIFIDSANKDEIKKWLGMGVIDGVTTNPTIMYNDGVYDVQSGAKEIAALINPRPLSIEVTTNDLNEMINQAKDFASWAHNIVIKIPQINQDGIPCYGVISLLEKEGIKINATAALSFGQAVLAAKSGATYVSIFFGRVTDEGGDGYQVIQNTAKWLERWNFKSKLIIGSIRSVGDVIIAINAGAHILTIPPQFLYRMADHKYTRETVKQFTTDAQTSLSKIRKTEK